jgi:hypothetical protein
MTPIQASTIDSMQTSVRQPTLESSIQEDLPAKSLSVFKTFEMQKPFVAKHQRPFQMQSLPFIIENVKINPREPRRQAYRKSKPVNASSDKSSPERMTQEIVVPAPQKSQQSRVAVQQKEVAEDSVTPRQISVAKTSADFGETSALLKDNEILPAENTKAEKNEESVGMEIEVKANT